MDPRFTVRTRLHRLLYCREYILKLENVQYFECTVESTYSREREQTSFAASFERCFLFPVASCFLLHLFASTYVAVMCGGASWIMALRFASAFGVLCVVCCLIHSFPVIQKAETRVQKDARSETQAQREKYLEFGGRVRESKMAHYYYCSTFREKHNNCFWLLGFGRPARFCRNPRTKQRTRHTQIRNATPTTT